MNKWKVKKRILIFSYVSMLLIEVILGIIYGVTKNKSLLYPMGFLCGILLVLFIAILLVLLVKKKPESVPFDERQLKNRGVCFCISFFVLLGCLLLDGLIRMFTEYEWSSYFVGVSTCSFISIAVFIVLAIWKDAYTTTNDSKVRLMILSFVVGLINLILSIIQIMEYGLLENGKMGTSFMNLMVCGLLMLVCVNLFIKYRVDKRKEFEDEELKTEVC